MDDRHQFTLSTPFPTRPAAAESPTRSEARHAAADLRHLQGVLVTLGRSREQSSLSPADAKISDVARRQAAEVARIAEILEQAVGPFEKA